MIGAYKSDLGIIIKNDEVDWLDYDECIKICAMAAFKKEMGYNIVIYPKKFIDFIDYWSGKIANY